MQSDQDRTSRGARIVVVSQQRTAEAAPDGTVLQALLDAGIEYPHGCETGLCSLCKSRCISGEIEQGEYFQSALSDDERAAGLFLPCTSHARGDCTISPVQHDAFLPPVRRFESRVRALRQLTHDTWYLAVEPPAGQPFEFLPGQYAQLDLRGAGARDFSMASLPGDDHVGFIVRSVPGGRVTEGVVPTLAAGDAVALKGPMGTAYLRETHLGPLLLAAGGSGLAPILSIVNAALQRGLRQPIHLYFGVRTRADLHFHDELHALAEAHPNLRLTVALSHEPGEVAEGRRGFVHELIRADLGLGRLEDYEAYVAGPPVMVDAVAEVLAELGLPGARCHRDPFLCAADVPSPTAAGAATPLQAVNP